MVYLDYLQKINSVKNNSHYKFLKWCLCILWGIGHTYSAKCFDMQSYLDFSSPKSEKDFLQKFPYGQYLQEYDLQDIELLNQHRDYVYTQQKSGDRFLYHLCKKYVETLDSNALNKNVQLGEHFLHYSQQNQLLIYKVMGNMILETVAHKLEKAIRTGHISAKTANTKKLVETLQKHQFIINIPPSKWEKLKYHISKGNWLYIWDRAKKEYGLVYLLLIGMLLMGSLTSLFYRKRIVNTFASNVNPLKANSKFS